MTRPATARKPRLDPLQHEALLLRHQQAIDMLHHPNVYGVGEIDPADRPSLLAAVVWPTPELLEWSLDQARQKLARRLGCDPANML